jgi:hypothetical protein
MKGAQRPPPDTKKRSIPNERAFHRQDAKGAKKDNRQCAFAVLGVLASWRLGDLAVIFFEAKPV